MFVTEYVPDLFSRISLEKFRIVQPECLEYPTQSKVQEYQTQLEVDNHWQILAEGKYYWNLYQTTDPKLIKNILTAKYLFQN